MACKHILISMAVFISLYVAVAGAQTITVQGLFPGSAVLAVNGKHRFLKSGQTSPEGIKLISATSNYAVFEINGKRQRMTLSTTISSNYSTPAVRRVVINKGTRNGYYTIGQVNGHSVKMLVDTGATHVALNSEHAKLLGINFRVEGDEGLVATASGTAKAWFLNLDSVVVGGIEVRNVLGAVTEGGFPTEILLGMSYLDHVKMEESDGVLNLIERY